MKAKDLILEAVNVAYQGATKIENNVLSRSTEARTEILSLASRTRDLYEGMGRVLKAISTRIPGEAGSDIALSLGSYFYVVVYSNEFVVVRGKPFHIMMSYSKGGERIGLKTRYLTAYLGLNSMEVSLYSIKTKLLIGSLEDYITNYNELKYVLKPLNNIVERYLEPLVEARLGVSPK